MQNRSAPTFELSEYKNPSLLLELNSTDKAIWLTRHLLMTKPYSIRYKLFDLKNDKCTHINSQDSEKLLESAKKHLDLDLDSLDYVKYYINHLFYNTGNLFILSPHQFATIKHYSITFWDAENPTQIIINQSVDNPIPVKVSHAISSTYTVGDMAGPTWYFQTAIFPNHNYVVSMVEEENFYFRNLHREEIFGIRTENKYNRIKVICNNQILLTHCGHYSEESTHALMVVDLNNKRAKIVNNILQNLNKKSTILPLAPGMIIDISPKKIFQCYEISPTGDKVTPIEKLKGCATFYKQFKTGEIIFWDEKTQYLNLLDPIESCIIPLQKLKQVSKILINGDDILIATPTQLLRASNPLQDRLKRTEQKLIEFVEVTDLRNIVLDYLGLTFKEKPLFTHQAFFKVKKSENKAEILDATVLSRGVVA